MGDSSEIKQVNQFNTQKICKLSILIQFYDSMHLFISCMSARN